MAEEAVDYQFIAVDPENHSTVISKIGLK